MHTSFWSECWIEVKASVPQGIGLLCRYGPITVLLAWCIHYAFEWFGGFDIKFR